MRSQKSTRWSSLPGKADRQGALGPLHWNLGEEERAFLSKYRFLSPILTDWIRVPGDAQKSAFLSGSHWGFWWQFWSLLGRTDSRPAQRSTGCRRVCRPFLTGSWQPLSRSGRGGVTPGACRQLSWRTQARASPRSPLSQRREASLRGRPRPLFPVPGSSSQSSWPRLWDTKPGQLVMEQRGGEKMGGLSTGERAAEAESGGKRERD